MHGFVDELTKLSAFAPETTSPDAYDGSSSIADAVKPRGAAAKIQGATPLAPRTNTPSPITSPSEMLGRAGGQG